MNNETVERLVQNLRLQKEAEMTAYLRNVANLSIKSGETITWQVKPIQLMVPVPYILVDNTDI